MNAPIEDPPNESGNEARLSERAQSLLRRVASDLLTIEVNTIIKPCMTARKMPPPPVALFDIADNYSGFLAQSAQHLEDNAVLSDLDLSSPQTNGPEAFARILQNAEFLEAHFSRQELDDTDEDDKRKAQIVILRRITHYSHLICSSNSGLTMSLIIPRGIVNRCVFP